MFPARHPRPLGRLAALGMLALTVAAPATAQEQTEPFSPASKQAFLATLDPAERDHVVDLEGRAFVPGLTKEIFFEAGRARVYVQFEQAPSRDQLERLYAAGVRFQQALNGFTYIAHLDRDELALLRQQPLLRGVEPIEAVDKLTPTLHSGDFMAHAANPDGSVEVRVRFHEDVSLRHALHVLDRWDVVAPQRDAYWIGNVLPATVTHGQALVLAEEQAVAAVYEIPTPPIEDNLNAAALSNVDDAQGAPHHLDGTGVRIGLWEGGTPSSNHPDLSGRLTFNEVGAVSDHATHVSTTIMGDGAGNGAALGMAPGTERLFTHIYDGDPANEQTLSSAVNGIETTNHSWGRVVGWRGNVDTGNEGLFGLYDNEARAWDSVARVSGLKIQKSAGNDRNDCAPGSNPPSTANCDGSGGLDGQQYDTIATIGTAKNILTIGAVDHVAGVPLASFSSSGPTDDGRIKPDLVADGVNLFSGWAQGVTIPSCIGLDYCTISGTSMSTPVATGTVALLIQKYRQVYFGAEPSAACIKAVLVNTAVDLGRPGPDYLFGHGLIDALAAADTIELGPVRIVEGALENGEFDEYLIEVPSGTPELDVTMSWLDPAGVANSSMKDAVHDLDLQLISPGGAVYYPYTHPLAFGPAAFTDDAVADRANPVDTVEHAHFDNPFTGVWRVRVHGTSVGVAGQEYCVASNLSFNLDSQPNIEVNGNLYFQDGCVGDAPQRKTLSVFNTGGAPLFINNITKGIGTNPDFDLTDTPSLPVVVQAGSHIDFSVLFTPMFPGTRHAFFRIHSNDVDEPLLYVDAIGNVGEPSLRVNMDGRGRFGIVQDGYIESRTLRLLNEGECDLEVTQLLDTGGNALFQVGEIPGYPAFPFKLFPGEQVDIPIVFGPSVSDYGLQTNTYSLISDDPTTPVLAFEVSARVPPPNIDITGSLDFGEVCPGELVEKQLLICNTGLSDLKVSSVDFDPPCQDFTIVNNPYPAVVSHDFCLPVTVRYTPTGAGAHACTLRIHSNDPDEPIVNLLVTGETPESALYVTPELEFEPTVIQPVDNGCEHVQPLLIANNGTCPLEVADVRLLQAGTDYELLYLPTLPTTLLPGEALGDGNLAVRFAPQVVQRHILATVEVDYVTNTPNVGDVATVQGLLCGEGVKTGARLTVWLNGGPVPVVDKITLYQILNPNTVNEFPSFVQSRNFVPLTSVPAQGACDAFVFHEEWGGASNPIVLGIGTYQVIVSHVVGGNTKNHAVRFEIDDACDFFSRLTLDISQP